LFVLENGGIIIDTPGMRELGIADSANGLETTFDLIVSLSQKCRFKDCTHTNEVGCSVIAAVNTGEIDKSFYENYLRLQRENAHYESTIAEKRKKDKVFGKLLKNYHKDINKE
jgi:ribosome biogenesis GTPase